MLAWLKLLVFGESRILEEVRALQRQQARVLTGQAYIIRQIGKLMSRTEDLSNEITELGTAVDSVASFISTLPTSVDEISQDQLDQLHANTARLVVLAQAAPEVPTTPVDELPVVGE